MAADANALSPWSQPGSDPLPLHRLRTNAYWHPYRGVYVPRSMADTLEVRCAYLLPALPPEARFSHVTAAALLRAPVGAPQDPIHVSVPAGVVTPRRREGLVTHRRALDGPPLLVGGLPVSAPEQVFLDLAPLLPLPQLVVLGDDLVRRWTNRGDLFAHLAQRRGQRGVVRARDAAQWVRDGVDSPPETLLRLVIVGAGLPEPEVNPDIVVEGEWVGRPDLAYRRVKIAIQYEGDVHRSNPRRWRLDIVRDERFQDAGWLVLRVVHEDVERPAAFLRRLERALRDRGWPAA